jgi:hypothetical protein
MAWRTFLSASFIVAIVAGVVALPGWAGETQEPVASAEAGPAVLSWQANVQHAGADVTVQGPDGQVVTRSFEQGEPLVLELSATFGSPLADGRYSWEVGFRPLLSPQARQELDAASGTDERDAVRRSLIERGELPAEPMVASSSFLVKNGAVWSPGTEGTAAVEEPQQSRGLQVLEKATVLATGDGVIQFSLCVGGDCPSSPSFGADTIRLMENNLRIHFDDTSSAASFPANDWRIVANDSSSGGDSYLAIEDATAGRQVFRVDAGAPANSLRVDAAGDVGIGTSDPVVELHVKDGDTPTLRLEQDGSSGFTAQTWDVAGNETNFFIRDTTNGSLLPFKIVPGAADNSLYIAANNDVGVGTASPDSSLHVRRSNGTAKVHVQEASATTGSRTLLELENNGNVFLDLVDNEARATWRIANLDSDLYFVGGGRSEFRLTNEGTCEIRPGGLQAFTLEANGDLTISGTLTEGSKRGAERKAAALDLQEVLDRLAKLRLQQWSSSSGMHLGPHGADLVSLFGVGSADAVAPTDVASVAVLSVQGLQQVVAEQESQIDALEAANQQLESRVKQLEDLIEQMAR